MSTTASQPIQTMRDRAILVTGSTRGIGLAIVRRLAESGASVVTCGRDQAQAEQVAASLPGEHFGLGVDLSDPDGPQRLVAAAAQRAGRLDGLVNSAGVSLVHPAATLDRAEWQRIVDLNLTASFFCMQEAAALMSDDGAIVNIASVVAIRGLPGRAAYSAAKAGIIALTRTLAVEWGPRLRVNAIAPGYIRTDLMDTLIASGKIDPAAIEARTPAGRFGTPDDVAACATFLLSEQASFITGELVTVDGGWVADGQGSPPQRHPRTEGSR